MDDLTAIAGLVAMSRYLGASSAYVQGAGGNASVKLSGGRMAVKASGIPLGEVHQGGGYAIVNATALDAALPQAADEQAYGAAIHSANLTPESRPSMETGFHAVLPGAVLHSHSVYANVLSCTAEGAAILGQILPDAVWIGYRRPGRDLSLAVAQHRDANRFVLANHGLILRADHAEAAIDLHERVNAALRARFGLLDDFDPTIGTGTPSTGCLFPDQAVYLSSPLSASAAARQVQAAATYVLTQIERLGLTPVFLPEDEVAGLLGMDAERYRMKVAS